MQFTKVSIIPTAKKRHLGFTPIELMGVLAILSILASFLVPRALAAVRDAQINTTALGLATVKTAVIEHYAKYNTLSQWNSNNTMVAVSFSGGAGTNLDGFLLMEKIIDKPFYSKIASSSSVQVVTNGGFAGLGYKLDGVNAVTTNQAYVAEVVLNGVALQDAIDLSTRIDGISLTASADAAGRVAYTNTNPTTVYVYLTGR